MTGLTPGTTYHYRLEALVSGVFQAHGADQTFTTAPLPTVVTTGSATGVTGIRATITGTINPKGVDTQYHFEYGTDTTYGSQTPPSNGEVGSDSAAHALSRTLVGLTPGDHLPLSARRDRERIYGFRSRRNVHDCGAAVRCCHGCRHKRDVYRGEVDWADQSWRG